MDTLLSGERTAEVIPFSLDAPVLYYPVRHHSPACARHLEQVIARYDPQCILVEGPENANDLIPVLTNPGTRAPVALYYAYRDEKRLLSESDGEPERFCCYYPFLDHSPELVALRAAAERGIPGRFMDLGYAEILRPYVKDTNHTVHQLVAEGRNVLFEGAQATMLDCDNGTYPYVTSSHPIAGGACVGAGIGPHLMQNIFGVVKAYSTRVGEGPFPTELHDATGDHIRETAHEYGTVTGRPRRVGWLDARAVRYAAFLNTFDYLAITRLDILDDMDEIKVCVGYEYEGKELDEYPADLALLEKVKPIYRVFPGWKTPISDIRSYGDLPENCRYYLEQIAALIGVPLGIVSVGPSREQTIVLKDVF